ncbi:MAG TPA: hypothetical protein VFV86_09005 [Nitrososphaeraceae archaeon]|nr:hypothetical protein [Nitrososphaeraceae archaeon]
MSFAIITVAKDDYGLIDYMIKSAEKYASNINQFIIVNNHDRNDVLKKYNNSSLIQVVPGRAKNSNSSIQHGSGLNKALPLITAKTTAIIEPDCVVLKKNFNLLPDGYDMIAPVKGTDINGVNYYHPCLMVFKTSCLKKVDFKAYNFKDKTGLPLGNNHVYSDTGWQISKYIKNNQVKQLKIVLSRAKERKIIPYDFGHRTNEFWMDDEVFGLHFWRGSEPSRRQAIPKLGDWPKQLSAWKKFLSEVI